jgi:hypothetical protein
MNTGVIFASGHVTDETFSTVPLHVSLNCITANVHCICSLHWRHTFSLLDDHHHIEAVIPFTVTFALWILTKKKNLAKHLQLVTMQIIHERDFNFLVRMLVLSSRTFTLC